MKLTSSFAFFRLSFLEIRNQAQGREICVGGPEWGRRIQTIYA